jgi:hypothetical protein
MIILFTFLKESLNLFPDSLIGYGAEFESIWFHGGVEQLKTKKGGL